jgi:hypothetical protein
MKEKSQKDLDNNLAPIVRTFVCNIRFFRNIDGKIVGSFKKKFSKKVGGIG